MNLRYRATLPILALALLGGGIAMSPAEEPVILGQRVSDAATAEPYFAPKPEPRKLEAPKPKAEPKPAPKPKPAAKPKPERKAVPASRSVTRAPAGWDAGNWGRFPNWVEDRALCVAKHESWHAGLWVAINKNTSITTASGFAQWINSSWQAQAKRAGTGTQYPRAYMAPPAVQAKVFAHQVMNHGMYPWAGSNC